MRRSSAAIVLITLALGLGLPALAGCGSGGEQRGSTSGAGGPQTLDRTALGAKADAICATYRSRFLEIELPSDLTDLTGVAAYATAGHALLQERHAELAALKPDASTKQQWDAFIAADRGTTEVLERLETAAKTKVVAKIVQVTGETPALTEKAVAAADAVGATGCGSSPG